MNAVEKSAPVVVGVDVCSDYPEHQLAVEIAAHGGRVTSYTPVGPAGGNPYYELEFPTEDAARGYIADYYREAGVDATDADFAVHRVN